MKDHKAAEGLPMEPDPTIGKAWAVSRMETLFAAAEAIVVGGLQHPQSAYRYEKNARVLSGLLKEIPGLYGKWVHFDIQEMNQHQILKRAQERTEVCDVG